MVVDLTRLHPRFISHNKSPGGAKQRQLASFFYISGMRTDNDWVKWEMGCTVYIPQEEDATPHSSSTRIGPSGVASSYLPDPSTEYSPLLTFFAADGAQKRRWLVLCLSRLQGLLKLAHGSPEVLVSNLAALPGKCWTLAS